MSSVSSINPGLAELLQTLSNVNSPLLSSQSAMSALENASPSDIVQLSTEAIQLQGVDTMFGISDGSSSSNSNMSDMLASLEASLTAPVPSISGGSTTLPSADQLAGYQASQQSAETAALFGTGSNGVLSDSLFNMIG